MHVLMFWNDELISWNKCTKYNITKLYLMILRQALNWIINYNIGFWTKWYYAFFFLNPTLPIFWFFEQITTTHKIYSMELPWKLFFVNVDMCFIIHIFFFNFIGTLLSLVIWKKKSLNYSKQANCILCHIFNTTKF